METSVEQKIINYESNLIKQAFFNNDVLLFLKGKVPESFFSNQVREVIWRTFVFICDEGEGLSRSSIEDVFTSSSNEAHIAKVWEIIDQEYPDESQWKYQYRYLYEIYAKANIIKVTSTIKEKINKKESSTKIIDWAVENLSKYDNREEVAYNVKESISRTREEILLRKDGKINPYIKSGSPKFDSLVKMDFNQIILIAAAKKIGKTKFIIDRIMEILAIDPSIAVKFYSFELSEKEIMYEMISRETNLTSEQIQSKDYTLKDTEIELIDEAFERLAPYDFEIATAPVTIEQVRKDFLKFCKQRNTNRCILVVDNIGLLKDKGGSQTAIDDHISSTFVTIRDSTKGLVFPIHHMTKDMDREDRLKAGYRPLLRHLKGSTRSQDFANKVLLLHRPGFYEDFVEKESAKGMVKLSNGNFQRKKVIEKLFIVDLALNRGGKKGLVRFLHKLEYCQFKEWK